MWFINREILEQDQSQGVQENLIVQIQVNKIKQGTRMWAIMENQVNSSSIPINLYQERKEIEKKWKSEKENNKTTSKTGKRRCNKKHE